MLDNVGTETKLRFYIVQLLIEKSCGDNASIIVKNAEVLYKYIVNEE